MCVKQGPLLWRGVCRISSSWSHVTWDDPAVPRGQRYPWVLQKLYKETCLRVTVPTFFVIVKNLKWLKCPLTETKKFCCSDRRVEWSRLTYRYGKDQSWTCKVEWEQWVWKDTHWVRTLCTICKARKNTLICYVCMCVCMYDGCVFVTGQFQYNSYLWQRGGGGNKKKGTLAVKCSIRVCFLNVRANMLIINC